MDVRNKLQVKEDMTGAVVGQPKALSLGLGNNSRRKDLDYIVVFLRNAFEVTTKGIPALGRLKEDGLAWFCYPKKTSGLFVDLSRDEGWEPLGSLGYRAVRQIAIDDTWSALRFRKR